jgi:hypothetical protein
MTTEKTNPRKVINTTRDETTADRMEKLRAIGINYAAQIRQGIELLAKKFGIKEDSK